MAKNVKESFWTSTSIAEQWWEDENDRKIDEATDEDKKKISSKADGITRNFRKILTKKLKFNETELDDLFRNTFETGKKSEFIFGNQENDIPDVMNDFLEIGKQSFITEEQREMLEECLLRLCPVTKDKDEAGIVVRQKNFIYENDGLILQKIEAYYIRTRGLEYFKKKILVDINTLRIKDDDVRKAIYNYQYELVKKWAIRWYFVMDEVEKIRMAEKSEMGLKEYKKRKLSQGAREIVYMHGNSEDEIMVAYSEEPTCLLIKDLCECLLVIYEEDREDNFKSILEKSEETEKDFEVGTKAECNHYSCDIYEKFLAYYLSRSEKEDNDYIIQKAFNVVQQIR